MENMCEVLQLSWRLIITPGGTAKERRRQNVSESFYLVKKKVTTLS